MKKYLLYSAFILLQSAVFAQNKIVKEIYLGTSHGVSLGLGIFRPGENITPVVGYDGGFFIVYKAQKVVGVKLGFNYVQKGWALNLDSAKNYSRTLNYYEVPFTTHVVFGNNRFKYLIDIGTYMGYLQSESEETNIPASEKDFVGVELDNDFDFGFCGGTGFQYDTGLGRIGLEVKYNLGLLNIFNSREDFLYYNSRNQSLSVKLIYTVKII